MTSRALVLLAMAGGISLFLSCDNSFFLRGTINGDCDPPRTTCQYPEDCYVAPYQGACGTPVDCADTQTCTGGTCQCVDSGPPCENLTTHVVTCCAVGEACNDGSCGMPLDGGT